MIYYWRNISLSFILCCLPFSALGQPRIEWHPVESKIPFFSDTHIEVRKDWKESDGSGHSFIQGVINGIDKYDVATAQELMVLISNKWRVDVVSLSSNRLLFLDKSSSRLVEYDLTTQTVTDIATAGRGPSDMFIPFELVDHFPEVLVPMAGFRIAVFDCQTAPCKMDRTVPLPKILALSLAVGPTKYYALRSVQAASTNPVGIAEAGRAAAAVVDTAGNIEAEFGLTYDFGTDMMLMDAFKRGYIRYFPQLGYSVLAYESFPIIYVYGPDNKMRKSYKVEGFKIGKQRYDRTLQEIDIPSNDFSLISQMHRLDKDHVLIEILHREQSVGAADKDTFEYYVIDLTTDDSLYLGSFDGTDIGLRFTQHGVVLLRNDEVYWIPNEKN